MIHLLLTAGGLSPRAAQDESESTRQNKPRQSAAHCNAHSMAMRCERRLRVSLTDLHGEFDLCLLNLPHRRDPPRDPPRERIIGMSTACANPPAHTTRRRFLEEEERRAAEREMRTALPELRQPRKIELSSSDLKKRIKF